MKSVIMYRQPRRAAIVSNARDDEIHTAFLLRRRKKLQIVLTIVLTLLSVGFCIFFLYLLGEEPQKTTGADAPCAAYADDYLCPDAIGLQEEIAKKVLRLHIRANSDTTCDQQIKLRVRDAVCAYLALHMDAKTKEEAQQYISKHLSDIISVADETLANAGSNYRASACLTTVNFPLRQYEDFFLPAGDYDALQIELGSGEGENWWCILFPTLCLNNALVIRHPDKTSLSAQKLAVSLEEKEFEAIQTEHEKITFRFRFLDLLRGRD